MATNKTTDIATTLKTTPEENSGIVGNIGDAVGFREEEGITLGVCGGVDVIVGVSETDEVGEAVGVGVCVGGMVGVEVGVDVGLGVGVGVGFGVGVGVGVSVGEREGVLGVGGGVDV